MGRPYSEDLRERIVGALAAGHSRRAAARMFGVSPGAVELVRREWPGAAAAPSGARGWSRPCPMVTGRPPPFVAGLRQSGLSAPFVADRPMNAAIFRTYVERCLASTLRPGDVVIMDNLSSHKVKGIAEAIEARNTVSHYPSPIGPFAGPD